MTSTTPPTLSADISVGAPPDAVYALLTDLPVLAELAEETTAMRWVSGDSARTGAVFKGDNANGRHHWTTTCTVSEAAPGRAFSWSVASGPVRIARWRYGIEPDGAGCRVTESMWDDRPWWLRRFGVLLTGTPDRQAANAEHMRLTLQRLKARAERPASETR
mgnify:CR=1 FL=1